MNEEATLDHVVEWFAERDLVLDRAQAKRFLPLFGEAGRAYRRAVGTMSCVDETYAQLNGTWTFIYRVIDPLGKVVGGYVSHRRIATDYSLGSRAIVRLSEQT